MTSWPAGASSAARLPDQSDARGRASARPRPASDSAGSPRDTLTRRIGVLTAGILGAADRGRRGRRASRCCVSARTAQQAGDRVRARPATRTAPRWSTCSTPRPACAVTRSPDASSYLQPYRLERAQDRARDRRGGRDAERHRRSQHRRQDRGRTTRPRESWIDHGRHAVGTQAWPRRDARSCGRRREPGSTRSARRTPRSPRRSTTSAITTARRVPTSATFVVPFIAAVVRRCWSSPILFALRTARGVARPLHAVWASRAPARDRRPERAGRRVHRAGRGPRPGCGREQPGRRAAAHAGRATRRRRAAPRGARRDLGDPHRSGRPGDGAHAGRRTRPRPSTSTGCGCRPSTSSGWRVISEQWRRGKRVADIAPSADRAGPSCAGWRTGSGTPVRWSASTITASPPADTDAYLLRAPHVARRTVVGGRSRSARAARRSACCG